MPNRAEGPTSTTFALNITKEARKLPGTEMEELNRTITDLERKYSALNWRDQLETKEEDSLRQIQKQLTEARAKRALILDEMKQS